MFDPSKDHDCEVLSAKVHEWTIAEKRRGLAAAVARANHAAHEMKVDPQYGILFALHLREIKSARISIRIHLDCLARALAGEND